MSNMDLKLWVVHNISDSAIDIGDHVIEVGEEIAIARNAYQMQNDPLLQSHVSAGHLQLTPKTTVSGIGEGEGGSTGSPDTTGIIRCAGVSSGAAEGIYIPFAPFRNGAYGMRLHGAAVNSDGAGGFSADLNLTVINGIPGVDGPSPWFQVGAVTHRVEFIGLGDSFCLKAYPDSPTPATRYVFVIIAAVALA